MAMRLIDVDTVMNAFTDECMGDESEKMFSCHDIDRILDEVPTVDAAPVVHGRWEDKPTGRYGQQQSWCSACRKPSGIGGTEKNRHRAYCPNCGAKMDI